MRTATVRDLRNSFPQVSKWIDAGETVEITKRGRLIARLVPATPRRSPPPMPDFLARIQANFGARAMTDEQYEAIRQHGNSQLDDLLS